MLHGIRGATTADDNTPESIVAATRELLAELIAANRLQVRDVASTIFTTTPDLDAEFPARAAHLLGWSDVAMLCLHEMHVPGSLPRCIRVLIHWDAASADVAVRHIYLKGARALRPDRALDRRGD